MVAQRVGLTPELCEESSAFKDNLGACQRCLKSHDFPFNIYGPLSEAADYCETAPPLVSSSSHLIPSSWLTTSIALSKTTFTGLGLDNIETVTTFTVAVEIIVTRSDWPGFSHVTSLSRQNSPTASPKAGDSGMILLLLRVFHLSWSCC